MNEVVAAIAEGRIEAFLQPIVPIGTAPPGLFEALARMRDTAGNVLEPSAFLGDAERTRTVTLVDLCMMDLVARSGPYPPGTRIFINLSDDSLHSQATLLMLEERIRRRRWLGDVVGFELRKETLPKDLDPVSKQLNRLSDLGCAFALDDFGTECARREQLELPVEYIKLAGQVVRDVDTSPEHLSLIRTTTALSRDAGKSIVAEWVDSEAVLRRLREEGVDYAQGFLLGKPSPISNAIGKRP
jgi:EAL domain-containing protein (putative c-di-GMP-specific phosphodiesterase class I)